MSTSRPVPKGPKVSPARTIVSLVVLLIVGTVCVIELRAGLGQYLTGKALTAKQKVDPQNGAGVFEQLTMDDARSLVKMFPTESVHRDDENEIVYRYQWYSMLRGLIGEKNPEIYISSSKGEPQMAQTFFTDGEEAGSTYVGPSSPDVGGNGLPPGDFAAGGPGGGIDRKSTRLNSSHT